MNVYLLSTLLLLFSCEESTKQKENIAEMPLAEEVATFTDSSASDISSRFKAPEGFTTVVSDPKSFAHYLQHLPLKPMGTEVKYYDGQAKPNRQVYCSVVDMDIDPQDLQQCADAVMRLRGEYLFEQRRYFLSDGKPRYFKDYAKGDYSYAKFRKYMKYIFSYANTGSLCDELESRPISDMQIGDVFVQKKQPYGHAVIVVNMSIDTTGNKQFMLAQSYMPAQETQILLNPMSEIQSPWFLLKEGEIKTPEWTFNSSDLKQF